MERADEVRAVAAATAVATELGLRAVADEAVVLSSSNALVVRLRPCEVVARIAPAPREVAAFEVALARRLAATGSPIAEPAAGVPPGPHERDGFVTTLWNWYEPVAPATDAPADYALALVRLHAGMRSVDIASPHFTDRVEEARRIVRDPARSPALGDPDRQLLVAALDERRRAIEERSAPEQLVHGEPHPGNVLRTAEGWRFVDLETCCRGPVEFDLAHVPEPVDRHYPNVDRALLEHCRVLVLAMVAAWRWEAGDQLPDGRRAANSLLAALRAGPPWPTLDALMP